MRRPAARDGIGVAVGLAVGFGVAQSDAFVDWIRAADWSALPATVIGTAIPGVAGFMFARAIAESSVRRIKSTELDAEREHQGRVDEEARLEALSIARSWAQLYDATRAVVPSAELRRPLGPVAEAGYREERAAWEVAKEQAKVMGIKAPTLRARDVEEMAHTRLEWPIVARRHLPAVLDALDVLVVEHRVIALQPIRDTFGLIGQLVERGDLWLPPDSTATEIRAMIHDESLRPKPLISASFAGRTEHAFRRVLTLAQFHRSHPHDADEATVFIDGKDVAAELSNLGDAIRPILAGSAPGDDD